MPATGAIRFNLIHATKNNVFPELAARMADLRPVLNEIINEWAKGNRDKFAKGKGLEEVGVAFNPQPMWEPLTENYFYAKREAGYANQLMVRTGALREALTTDGMFKREVEPYGAVFGEPVNESESDKVGWNWDKRQVVFLDDEDGKTIAAFWNDYLTLGPKFRQVKAGAKLEDMRMQAEFEAIVRGGA